jgi:hypothetical protein
LLLHRFHVSFCNNHRRCKIPPPYPLRSWLFEVKRKRHGVTLFKLKLDNSNQGQMRARPLVQIQSTIRRQSPKEHLSQHGEHKRMKQTHLALPAAVEDAALPAALLERPAFALPLVTPLEGVL